MSDEASDPRKSQNKAINEGRGPGYTEDGDDDIALNASTCAPTAQNPRSITANAKSDRYCRERREKVKLGFEIATFFAVLGYAAIAAFQWRAMLDTNRATAEAAHAAKESADAAVAASRAWMVPAGTEADGPGSIILYFKNAGKSPAIHVVGTAEYAMQWPSKLPEGCAALKNHEINGWTTSQPLVLPNDTFIINPLQSTPPKWAQPLKPEHVRNIYSRMRLVSGRSEQSREID